MNIFKSLIFVILFSSPVFAQEAVEAVASENEISAPADRPSHLYGPYIQHFTFLFGAYPVPLISGGVRGAIEIKAAPYFSVWLETGRDEDGESISVGKHEKITWTDQIAGIRLYQKAERDEGFFLHLGHMWTEVRVMKSTGMFNATAETKKTIDGAFGGLGYRLETANRHWVAEGLVNWEPAREVKSEYIADEIGILGVSRAHLQNKYSYAPVFHAKLGYNF